MAEKYEGWTNYETWAVNLWLLNDAGDYEYWLEMAGTTYKEAEKSKYLSKKEEATITLADFMKESIEEFNPVTDASLYSDLMSSAIG